MKDFNSKIDEMTKNTLGARDFVGSLVIPEQTADNYVLGGGNIPDLVIMPDGDWTKVPIEKEEQNKKFETWNCTSFNTLSQIEKMEYVITGKVVNYSDRWLGIMAGTRPPGNDPHRVCEAIRNHGLIPEEMLPWSDDLQNVDEYYSWKGGDREACVKAGQEWLKKWEFLHEWLFDFNAPLDVKLSRLSWSLLRCPPSMSVTAWELKDGLYVDSGGVNNHWTCKDGELINVHHKCRDSYLVDGSDLKLIAWKHNIYMAKRYYMKPKERVVAINWIQKLLNMLREMVYEITANKPVVTTEPVLEASPKDVGPEEAHRRDAYRQIYQPKPTQPPYIPEPAKPDKPKVEASTTSKLGVFCDAIQDFEEWVVPGGHYRNGSLAVTGSKSYRNKNPGNIKFTSLLKSLGALHADSDGFSVFATYEDGMVALRVFVTMACKNELRDYKNKTIRTFFQVYSGGDADNILMNYAVAVAKALHVSIDYPISNLIK